MNSFERARRLAEDHFNAAPHSGERCEIGLYEFGHGYVAWIKQPEPADPTSLPDIVGGSCIVIDKQTAQIHVRPLLGPEIVADHYRRSKPTAET
jgi:hypothetical protein